MDWLRWHHGTVTDQKFPLIARKSGASVAEVIAVWACLLEAASLNERERGMLDAEPDFEAMDCALGMQDGRSEAVFRAMADRKLIDDGLHLTAWKKRQPKREREDDQSTDRVRAFREKKRHEEPCNAMERQETPRGEEIREEKSIPTPDGVGGNEACASPPIDDGMPSCPHQQIVAAFHAALPGARHVREWTPARASLLRTRWREKKNRQRIEWWDEFFAYVAESPFLTGHAASNGRKPFELGLEWLLKAENFAKVIEGAYHEAKEVAA